MIVADVLLKEIVEKKEDFDAIVLPGGMPGATNFHKSKLLNDLLTKQLEAKKTVAAICASPAVVLAQGGHLKAAGVTRATCYPVDKFKQMMGKDYEDGNVI